MSEQILDGITPDFRVEIRRHVRKEVNIGVRFVGATLAFTINVDAEGRRRFHGVFAQIPHGVERFVGAVKLAGIVIKCGVDEQLT